MAANKINVRKTRDSTWEYEVKADDAVATLDLAYTDDSAGWAARCPMLGSGCDDIPGLELQRIKTAGLDGGQIRIALHYEGTSSKAPGRNPDAPAVTRYDVEIATGEENLLTHPYYDDLTELERRGLLSIMNGNELDDAGSPWSVALTSALALHALARIRKGFVSWLKPSVIYVERSTITTLADLNFLTVGKKESPPGPVAAMPGHWLYLGATATNAADGLSWSRERRWRFSDTEWDSLYDVPAT